MPWKKKSGRSSWRRGSFRKGPSTTTLQKTKANKRFNWVEVIDSTCSTLQLEPRICGISEGGPDAGGPRAMDCTTGEIPDPDQLAPAVRIVFLPPATPATSVDADQGAYQNDDVSVVRVVGGIWLMPFWTPTAAFAAYALSLGALTGQLVRQVAVASRSYFLRAGLKKESCEWNPQVQEYQWPERDPFYTEEFTDGRYLRMWTKEMMAGSGGHSTVAAMSAGSQLGCCGVVTGGGGGSAINTLTDGTGNIDTEIDDVETECVPCNLEGGQVTTTVLASPQRPIYLPMNFRKRWRFRENEGLALHLNYAVPNYIHNPNCGSPYGSYTETPHGVGFILRAHVKMLIET